MEKAGTKFQNENLMIQEKVLGTEYFNETWHECYLESLVLKYILKFSITFFYWSVRVAELLALPTSERGFESRWRRDSSRT